MGKLKEIYRFFGTDEPNYAYMKDGRKLLKHLYELHDEGPYFPAHNLMCPGPGTAALKWDNTNMYTGDENGNPVYNWEIIDLIFDTYLENGVRPYCTDGVHAKGNVEQARTLPARTATGYPLR